MSWLTRHSDAIQAAAAAITAATAVLAVAGVLLQMRAADATSKAQTARESYAAHLALAVANPDFADPTDPCALAASPKGAGYAAYIDHLLYAAEQMLEVDPSWDATFVQALAPHAAAICAGTPGYDTAGMTRMLADFRASNCPATPICQSAD